jgi:hypothetical protein
MGSLVVLPSCYDIVSLSSRLILEDNGQGTLVHFLGTYNGSDVT